MLDVDGKIPADSKELLLEAQQDIMKLTLTIAGIFLHHDDWIVSKVVSEGPRNEVTRVDI